MQASMYVQLYFAFIHTRMHVSIGCWHMPMCIHLVCNMFFGMYFYQNFVICEIFVPLCASKPDNVSIYKVAEHIIQSLSF